MRRMLFAVTVTAVALVTARVHAAPATCTVTQLDVVGTFPFYRVGAVGLVLPVDIDTATGRFTLQRDAFTTPYPSPGFKFQTGFGPFGWLDWDPGPIDGTIDSNGQVVLPNFGMRFWTDFSTPNVAGLAGSMTPNLTTGIQAQSAANRYWLFFGRGLDTSSGSLRLEGTGLINFQLPLQTGTGLTCTLAPIPNLADLPKGPTLVSAKGKVKAGPAAHDDELTLTAAVLNGARAPVLDGSQDVLLRLKPASGPGEALNLLVLAGNFRVKGKKLSVQDGDGSLITAISDQPPTQDQPPAPFATSGGSLVVKGSKKRTTFIYKVKGVETGQLTGAVDVTIGVGPRSASRQVTFTPGKKGPKFH